MATCTLYNHMSSYCGVARVGSTRPAPHHVSRQLTRHLPRLPTATDPGSRAGSTPSDLKSDVTLRYTHDQRNYFLFLVLLCFVLFLVVPLYCVHGNPKNDLTLAPCPTLFLVIGPLPRIHRFVLH
jgi:hypothetical protein